MADQIPPSPVDAPFGSYNWQDWFFKVRTAINSAAAISWSQITNFTGSNLNQLATRSHQSLQNILGTTIPNTAFGHAPVGGSTGQVLAKVSATDYDYTWATASGGSTVTITAFLGNNINDASLGGTAPAFAKIITSGGSAQTIEASIAAAVGDRIEAIFTGTFVNSNIPAVTLYFDLALFFNGAGINQWVEQSIDSSPTRVQTVSFIVNRIVQAGDISGGNVLIGVYSRIYGLPITMLNSSGFVPVLSIKNFGP